MRCHQQRLRGGVGLAENAALCRVLPARLHRRLLTVAAAAGGGSGSSNPLELLRVTRDPQQRARLMQELDTRMSEYSELYVPSPTETYLAAELGVWSYNVMLFAVQHPALQGYCLDTQVKPAIGSLKAAGLAPNDVWFLLSRRLELLGQPLALQRWLDFLNAQDTAPRDAATFLLHAPAALLASGTQANALAVLAFLRGRLAVKTEHLYARIVCAVPGVLAADVDGQLAPLVDFLGSLGLEPSHVGRLACIYPELLTSSLSGQLAPLVSFYEGLGCTTQQAARLLQEAPHALAAPPADVFGRRLAALEALGLDEPARRRCVRGSTLWLTAPGAPQEQIDFLRNELGYNQQQVRDLVLACPAILSEKVLELQRKVDFLREQLNMELGDLLAHPAYLGASLMQVIGPRHAFAVSRGLEAKLTRSGASCTTPYVAAHGGGWGWDLTALVSGEDVDFVSGRLGGSVNEYEGFRSAFEEEYTASLSAAAAREFQDELRKLGIYEGA